MAEGSVAAVVKGRKAWADLFLIKLARAAADFSRVSCVINLISGFVAHLAHESAAEV